MSKDRFFSGGGQSEIDALESGVTTTRLLYDVLVNTTDRSADVTEVRDTLIYNPYLKMGIVNIRFLITSATPPSGLCLGNWVSTYVPKGPRPTTPVIRDSDGGIEGSLYANIYPGVNTKIMVYGISSYNGYHIAQFPVFLVNQPQ